MRDSFSHLSTAKTIRKCTRRLFISNCACRKWSRRALEIFSTSSVNSLPNRTNLLFYQMLQKDRSKRMGAKRDFAEVKEHPFFLAIDWDKLLRREVKPPFCPRVKDAMDISYIDREFTEQVPSGMQIKVDFIISVHFTRFINHSLLFSLFRPTITLAIIPKL